MMSIIHHPPRIAKGVNDASPSPAAREAAGKRYGMHQIHWLQTQGQSIHRALGGAQRSRTAMRQLGLI
jgi:hypothetical protein